MSLLKAVDFPPPPQEAVICLKPTAYPNCRVGGIRWRVPLQSPRTDAIGLSSQLPRLSGTCERSLLPHVQLSGALNYIRKSARSHMVRDQKRLQEVIIVRHGDFLFRGPFCPRAVYIHCVRAPGTFDVWILCNFL